MLLLYYANERQAVEMTYEDRSACFNLRASLFRFTANKVHCMSAVIFQTLHKQDPPRLAPPHPV
jgi:hypothetical protein